MNLLKEILEDQELIMEYDKLREQFKGNRSLYSDSFQTITAKVEVKLQLTKEHCLSELKRIEKESLQENTTLSVLPKDCHDIQKYELVKRKLSIIKSLGNQFNL